MKGLASKSVVIQGSGVAAHTAAVVLERKGVSCVVVEPKGGSCCDHAMLLPSSTVQLLRGIGVEAPLFPLTSYAVVDARGRAYGSAEARGLHACTHSSLLSALRRAHSAPTLLQSHLRELRPSHALVQGRSIARFSPPAVLLAEGSRQEHPLDEAAAPPMLDSGIIMWHALLSSSSSSSSSSLRDAWGNTHRLVSFPVSDKVRAVVGFSRTSPTTVRWTTLPLAKFHAEFSPFISDCDTLLPLSSSASAHAYFPRRVRLQQLQERAESSVALLGDMQHSMCPSPLWGAALAVEDAVTAAAHVASGQGHNMHTWSNSRLPRWRRAWKEAKQEELALTMTNPARLWLRGILFSSLTYSSRGISSLLRKVNSDAPPAPL